MPTIAELIKKATGSSPDEMAQAVKTLNELYGQTAMGQQDFGPEDSTIASTVAHPIKGAGKLAEWFRGNVNTAAGYSDPFDNPNPLLGPSMDKKAEAGLNLAGMLQTGAMPFAPKSAGGTLGTMIKQGTPDTEFTRAHALAQKNAALPIEQGGLGLHPENTAMERAKALGFDTNAYHGTGSGDLIGNELIAGGAGGAKTTGDAYGMGVYTSTSPNTANAYAKGEAPAVFPLMVNRQRFLNIDYPKPEDYEKLSKYAGEVMLPSDKARFEGGKKIKEFSDLQEARDFFAERRKDWEMLGGGYDRARPNALMEKDGIPKVEYTDFFGDVPITNPEDAFTLMRSTGWDNIPSMGYEGHTMLRNKNEDWDITRNTKNIRSRFAAFDPMKKDSANILASVLGGTALASQYDKKKKLKDMK